MKKTNKRNIINAAIVQKTVDITGVSARQIRRVINGDSKNEYVLAVYMELKEGDNKLVKAVKNAVPIPERKKSARA